MTNRTIVCERPERLGLRDDDTPHPEAADDAILRIRRVGLCGTDIHAYRGEQPFFSYPRILGHELAGEVVELGSSHPTLKVGDRVTVVPYLSCGTCVACRRQRPNCCTSIEVLGVHTDGGLREYLRVPASALVPAGPLGMDELALVECLAIGAHGVRRAQLEQGETVLVLGAGPIGLGVAQFAHRLGARVLLADLRADRLLFSGEHFDFVETLPVGQDQTLEQLVRDHTGGDFPTAVFDATGNVHSMNAAIGLCAHSARLVYVGLVRQNIEFAHPEFHKRELTLMASRNATHADFEDVISGLHDGSIRASCYVTHRTSLTDFVADFPRWALPETGVVKGVVEV